MTWTYDINMSTVKDQVRRIIGDTNETAMHTLQDEEINFFATLEDSRLYETAADAAETLASAYATAATSKSVGSMSLARNAYENYQAIAADLRAKSALLLDASPQVGGISIADKQLQQADSDRVLPFFTRHTGEIPGTRLSGGLEDEDDFR